MEELSPLAVSVIGSWAIPGWYAQFLDDAGRRPELYGDDDRAEAVVDAIRLAIDDQERAGAEVISDGEMQRFDGHPNLGELFTGLERIPQPRKLGAPGIDQTTKFQCVGPIAAPRGLGLVDEYKRVSGMTTSAVKIAVPGPITLASALVGGKVYRDRDAVAEVLLPIVNREIRALVDAGATMIQLDEPGSACKPNDPEPFLRLVQRTTAGVKAFVSLHLCFGNFRGRAFGPRTYRGLLAELSKAAVQQLALEFASREMAEVEILKEIKPPMRVAVGLVDVKNNWVEPPELVADRLRTVLKYIDAERVHVVPDCGFSQTPRAIAFQKLKNLSAGVAIVRKDRGL